MKTKGIATWVYVNHLDTKYGEWKCTLEIDKTEAAKLRAVGLGKKIIKDVDDDTDVVTLYFKFVRNELNKKTGKPNPKPDCVDAGLKPYDGAVGNGSEVIVKHKPYVWENTKYGTGTNTDFQALQVINLVEYIPEKTLLEGDDDEGFEVVGDGLGDDDEGFTNQESQVKDSASSNEEY